MFVLLSIQVNVNCTVGTAAKHGKGHLKSQHSNTLSPWQRFHPQQMLTEFGSWVCSTWPLTFFFFITDMEVEHKHLLNKFLNVLVWLWETVAESLQCELVEMVSGNMLAHSWENLMDVSSTSIYGKRNLSSHITSSKRIALDHLWALVGYGQKISVIFENITNAMQAIMHFHRIRHLPKLTEFDSEDQLFHSLLWALLYPIILQKLPRIMA